MNILLYIAAFVFIISLFAFIAASAFLLCAQRGRKRTQKGTATLLQVITGDHREGTLSYEIEYTCDGIVHKVIVDDAFAEGVPFNTPAGTRVPIWYDPKKPERVVIAEDPAMRKTVKSWKRNWKHSLIWMLLSLGVVLFVFSRQDQTSEQPLTAATIGQFSQELSALAKIKPDRLTYTESVSGADTCVVIINDATEAKRILTILLNTPVSRVGCQVDMAQLRYEEYCFFFGDESFTFTFLPYSYFCYGGQDYELGANRLAELSVSLHEMAETKPE